jgi:hypothetical protein
LEIPNESRAKRSRHGFVQQSLRQAVEKILAVASKDVAAQLTPTIPVAA